MLTGADSSFGIPAVRLVRRAGKRKTLYVIRLKLETKPGRGLSYTPDRGDARIARGTTTSGTRKSKPWI